MAAQFSEGYTPFEYRWAAMAIRKRAKKSKALAAKHSQAWLTKQLPRAIPLNCCTSAKYQTPGVYVVVDHDEPLYVGETRDVRGRVEQILNTESWMNFGPKSVQLIDTSDQQMNYGLQSFLIGRTNPVLNSVLLRPDCESAI